MTAYDELLAGMAAGRTWSLMGDSDAMRGLLDRVYDERRYLARHLLRPWSNEKTYVGELCLHGDSNGDD